ncbi:hypothetical protein BH11BAC1_BH11BAC1_27440 [soil metagenome]
MLDRLNSTKNNCMKKIFLLVAIIAHGTFAKSNQPFTDSSRNKTGEKSQRFNSGNHVTQSPPFFTEDFASGIPGTWTNVDNSGNNVQWRTTTTGAFNTFTPVDEQLSTVGTSALNGYLIMDSDSAGLAGTASQNTDLTTTAINCTGHTSVFISFSEYFAQYGNSTGTVRASNDGIAWVDVHMAHQGLVSDSGTANPYLLEFDISAIAAGQSTVYIRFTYEGANDYWWFVDDLQLYEPSATDLAVNSIGKLNEGYTQVPLSQATTLNLSAEVKNMGLNAATNGSALLEVVDAGSTLTVFSETINLSSINPGASQTVVPSTGFGPSTAGMYYSRVTVSIAGDGNVSNDVLLSDTVTVSDTVYARDDNGYFGVVLQVGAGAGEDGIAGQNFLVNSSGDLTSVTVFLKDTFSFNAAGTPLFLTVHPQVNDTTGPDGAVLLASTETLLLFPGMIPAGGAFYTIPIQGGFVHLMPGLYFIGFHEDSDMIPMAITSNIYSAGAVWVHFNSIPSPPAVNGWAHAEDFGFQVAYMIRANFGLVPDAVNEISTTMNAIIFPNPSSSGVFNVRVENAQQEYAVEVLNVLGECVHKLTMQGVQEALLDLSNVPVGIYSIHIYTGHQSAVEKICVVAK